MGARTVGESTHLGERIVQQETLYAIPVEELDTGPVYAFLQSSADSSHQEAVEITTVQEAEVNAVYMQYKNNKTSLNNMKNTRPTTMLKATSNP